ncbi:hypothetical protein As57867_016807, partial [Aphanomyces stellatus]
MVFKIPLADVSNVAQRAGVTVAEFTKLAWAATLRKYTRQNDVVFGQVLANRDIPVKDADRILGPLLSTVPCRVKFDDAALLSSLMSGIELERGDMMCHTHASLIDLKRWSAVEGDLFDTLFVFQNMPGETAFEDSIGFSVLETEATPYSLEYTFELIVEPNEFELIAHALYKPSMVSRTQARLMLDEFEHTLDQLYTLVETDASVCALWELSPAQTKFIKDASFGPEMDLPYELLHHAFEEWAEKRPDARAIEFEGEWLSYEELNKQANTLACELVAMGVCVGSRVAVIMERCLEFPIGLLAVLKAGGAMLPLDATLPFERISYISSDANVRCILTTKSFLHQLLDLDISIHAFSSKSLRLKPQKISTPSLNSPNCIDEAYVVYTSGSTGRPKGVSVSHLGASNVMLSIISSSGFIEGARVMQFMAIGFDVCIWEIWKTLSFGATLVFRTEELARSIEFVNVLMCTPTALMLLGNPVDYPNLTTVFVGGEAIPSALKDTWCPFVSLYNCYGPSECSITTHFNQLILDTPVDLGHPIENSFCCILDDSLRQVPVGVLGEICLGGVGICRGYINLPAETDERFIINPFTHTDRLYRSGDVGRLLPNGHFEILGRKDSQVKLKGYRIELDEVAVTMMKHHEITSSSVIVKEKSYLVGFFTPAHVDVEKLRATMASHLPAYMIPSVWVGLESMPQNSNGKIDKKALESYQLDTRVDDLETDSEKKLANVWQQVLGVNVGDIGRYTSFFSLGGDSIIAIRLVAKAKQVGLILTGAIVMKYPTLESMARMVKFSPIGSLTPVYEMVSGEVPLTPVQHLNFQHPWRNVNFWNLSMTQLNRQTIGLQELVSAVSRLVDHHDMLRTRFREDAETGWTQYVLDADSAITPNVEHIHIDNFDELEAAVMQKEKSLNLINGPIYAVTLFETPDYTQYLQFTLHHTIVDLVSWRILLDDLQTVLQHGKLSSKTTSYKEWSERLTHQALIWDSSQWIEYIGNDIEPPTDRSNETILRHQVRLQADISKALDVANTVYGTNIQDIALAALAGALAQVRDGTSVEGEKLFLMLEGHGREPWDSSIDLTSTVGWFSCEYPVVITATNNISALVRQVKQMTRSVPDKGLSYGAIKYLAPKSELSQLIQSHQRHNITFNYAGRFQEMSSKDNKFGDVDGINIPQHDEVELPFSPGMIGLSHFEDTLVLDISVPDWLFNQIEVTAWGDLWCEWMTRICSHCLDPDTIGGRTLSDVPLLGSTKVLDAVEHEMMYTLQFRPLDVEDIYPITPLQSGLLSAMIRDPSEYVLQLVFDIHGDFSFSQLETCWRQVALEIPLLRTVFTSTSYGIYQAVTKSDMSEWCKLNEIWSVDEINKQTQSFLNLDRQRGFTLSAKSFQRFTGVDVSDGRTRVVWTHHHSLMDGWSLPLLLDRLLAICHGENRSFNVVPFKNHVEWLAQQPLEPSQLFWRSALSNINKCDPMTFPKPLKPPEQQAKHTSIRRSVELPELDRVCKSLGVTPSSVFRSAWAVILQQYTRSDFVAFGSVVSGRDTGL